MMLRMAYADPPYIGQSKRHYKDHPDYAGEVDHEALIAQLVSDYPDGWALSASSPTLRFLLPLCPEEVRVMAWVKPFAAFKRNVRVAYCWEPVIVKVAERLDGAVPCRDFIAESITMERGLTGVKPDAFCRWLFQVMGLRPGDEFHDLFPGSGAVIRAWRQWCGLPPEEVYEQGALDFDGMLSPTMTENNEKRDAPLETPVTGKDLDETIERLSKKTEPYFPKGGRLMPAENKARHS